MDQVLKFYIWILFYPFFHFKERRHRNLFETEFLEILADRNKKGDWTIIDNALVMMGTS